jgi:hypothetical protein
VPVQATPGAIEIKVNVATEHAEEALRRLRFDVAESKQRRIWFYEHVIGIDGRTALPLFHRSVILRVRRRTGRDQGDVTVKLRGTTLVLPDEWTSPATGRRWNYKIEGDWTGDRRTTAASLSADFDHDDPTARRVPRLSKLLMARQIDLLHRAFAVPIDVTALRPLGPISARVWRPTAVGFAHDVAAERWHAGSLQFLELSLRVEGNAEVAQRDFGAFLRERGVHIADLTETKTELVLRHFTDGRHVRGTTMPAPLG